MCLCVCLCNYMSHVIKYLTTVHSIVSIVVILEMRLIKTGLHAFTNHKYINNIIFNNSIAELLYQYYAVNGCYRLYTNNIL